MVSDQLCGWSPGRERDSACRPWVHMLEVKIILGWKRGRQEARAHFQVLQLLKSLLNSSRWWRSEMRISHTVNLITKERVGRRWWLSKHRFCCLEVPWIPPESSMQPSPSGWHYSGLHCSHFRQEGTTIYGKWRMPRSTKPKYLI